MGSQNFRLPFIVLALLCWCCTYSDDVSLTTIRLPEPMMDAKGNLLSSVHLPGGSAAILRKADAPAALAKPPVNEVNLRSNKSIKLGGYFFGGWEAGKYMSQAQLNWIGQHLDVLCLNTYYTRPESNLNGGVKPDDILWLKQLNPNLKYYSMLFATTLREPIFNPATMSDWVIKNHHGKEVLGLRRGHDLDVNHTMDLGNRDYQKFFREFAIQHANEYHADGVAIDEIMWKGYWDIPVKEMVNFRSLDEITAACYEWLEAINTNNPKEIIHQAFWNEAQEHSDGVWGEGSFHDWFREDHEYQVFYETMNYREIIDNLSHIGSKGETYIWAAYYDRTDPAQLEYSLATYLLGKSGDYVVFQPQPVFNGGYPQNLGGYDIRTCIQEYEAHKSLFDVELGNPKGDYYIKVVHHKPIYVREFERGTVYVNPND